MKIYSMLMALVLIVSSLSAGETTLPEDMQKIMDQPKYAHAIWGLYVQDLQTGEILYDLNSNAMFSPASTSKLFSVAALLEAYGDDYRFKTPVYATGPIKDGQLQGNLVLVAQGDLTMGGRQPNADTIAFTKLDHINANEVPGVIVTSENPLYAFDELAKQVAQKGIKEITGDVILDDMLFNTIQMRGMMVSPIMVNENLIDLVINPSEAGQKAKLSWRPQAPGYTVENQVKTVKKDGELALEVSADDSGKKIVIKGTIPVGRHDIVRTSNIKDPASFAQEVFIQALQKEGVKVKSSKGNKNLKSYKYQQEVALWISPPLSEYAKLILKVSHNLGANLVPLLLAAKNGKKTFDEGMLLLGDFITKNVKLPSDSFVFVDGAGGNENRLTPQGEITLLEYMHRKNKSHFTHYFDALPILGVDGSLEDFAKKTQAVGKVRAKPGTGVSFNLSTGKFFLITQALSGYIEGKNGHMLAYMVVINNGSMPAIDDIFPIFEDVSLLSSMIYDHSDG
ncbi:MAG TPA: D-alanyl-D-alanine carboxypeptidase/D-alanyl-D-alanine-endopeptidase, partial [Rhabdochlamydiaceae bacterium]|nr:D-alanyl-D-alanine carboxypeptidase/D-alanyl-D-alanine-endopeptidase [Rhabdochlamydiaceae bacterium]